MYLDTAYIAKYSLNEHDSPRVCALIEAAESRTSSILCVAEMACVVHRHMRQGTLQSQQVSTVLDTFSNHVENGLWTLLPLTESLVRRAAHLVSTAPGTTFLRAGDAIHLTTALLAGESEIWASDRHMLAAAPHFGLTGRSA